MQLQNLRTLELVNLNLESSINSSVFTSLNKLEVLDLSYNKFYGDLPVEINNLKNLKILNLENNLFSGQLPTLANLTKLVSINLGNN